MIKTAFIGHRNIFAKDLTERLTAAIRTEIANGCKSFTMGTHGEFDSLALSVCRQLRSTYTDLEIEVVITSLNSVKYNNEFGFTPYSDVKTIMYDIESAHYKQQITLSNKQMIDTCDTLICFVDTTSYRSGAKAALHYAQKKRLNIINLYRNEDKPFYGMTQKEIDDYNKKLFEKLPTIKKTD